MKIEGNKLSTIVKRESISCPPEKNKNIWKAHPRVYLTPNNKGIAVCPYCSVKYKAI